MNGRVERPGHRADLVGSVVTRRPGEVSRGIPACDPGDGVHPLAEEHRAGPGEQQRRRKPGPGSGNGTQPNGGQMLPFFCHGQGQAHVCELGS